MKDCYDANSGQAEGAIDQQEKPKKKRRLLPIVITVVLAALALFSGVQLVRILITGEKYAAEFQELRELVRPGGQTTSEADTGGAVPQEELDAADYQPLYDQNPDYAAWLSIDGTGLDYPVMHTPDRPDYYLRRNFYGEASAYGVPYLAGECKPDSSDNLIVYGHSIRGGRMFGELFHYEQKEYWEAHQTISLDTRTEQRTYQIIAVLRTTVNNPDGDAFPYYSFFDAPSAAAYDKYVGLVERLALYDTGISASYGEQLLTLSTCAYDNADTDRFLVVAKLIASTPVGDQ